MDRPKLIEDEASPDPLVGQLIKGRYRILRKLATGRTGVVYLAQMGTGARVALKLLQNEYARDKTFVKRFRRLMLAVAALSKEHANIVRVFECEQMDDGGLLIAMEHLDGKPLSDVLRAGVLDVERALFLAQQMAEGLNAIHAADIVHADVRPENFLVVGRIEAIKIIGFERARLGDVGVMDHLVGSGVSPGIPEYLAPEQIQGKDITRRTDIYALGVVLYHMLTGAVPFRASTPEEVFAMHLREAPTPLRDIRPEIPVALEAKVLQALEKEPQKRESYATDVVNEFLYDLVMEELEAGDAQEEEGLKPRTRVTIQRAPRGRRSIATDHERVRARWKLAAIIGLLILVAAPALWMAFSRWNPKTPSAPSPQRKQNPVQETAPGIASGQNPGPVRQPGPEMASKPGERTTEIPSLPAQGGISSETVPSKSASEETKQPAEKRTPPAPKQKKTRTRQSVRNPLPTQIEAPAPQAESPSTGPDPTEVIDWILKQR